MYIDMQMQEVQLTGVTKDDIQAIYENVLKEYGTKARILYLDASYLYTFHLDDFPDVRKFNMLGRYYAQKLNILQDRINKRLKVDPIQYEIALADNKKYCLTWHNNLERWLDGHYILLGGRKIKPVAISRTLDRVTNEGMEMLAQAVTGLSGSIFQYRSIGDGTASTATPGDKILGNEIDRINVNDTPEGGSLTRDGTTIFSVGNHSKTTPTPDDNEFTECGMHDTDSPTTDRMFDHSIFDDPIPHTQNELAPGSTTVVYQCSG